MFARNDYLSWYVPRLAPRARPIVNLHASGMPWVEPDSLPMPPGDSMRDAHLFEAELAAWEGWRPEEILFTPGATGGTLLALLALATPVSRVLVEDPIYEPMWRQAARLCPRTERFRRRADDAWRVPLDELRARLAPDVALVMITEPHNPSGALSPREDILALAESAREVGATLLVNEVYRGFSGTPSYHGAADNVVVVGSLSKLFGAYPARAGWLAAPAPVTARLRWAHANMGMATASGARAARAFLAEADLRTARAREVSAAGLATVAAWVAANPALGWTRPQGPGFATVTLPEGTDDLALAERLHDEGEVLVVPGHFFQLPGTLRLSWLQAGEHLERGLAVLASHLRAARVPCQPK